MEPPLSQVIPGKPYLIDLGWFSTLKAPAFLLWTQDVSALILLLFVGISCPDLILFDYDFAFICLST